MQTKEELAEEIKIEISIIRDKINATYSSDKNVHATYRVAISHLYIALSNLTK